MYSKYLLMVLLIKSSLENTIKNENINQQYRIYKGKSIKPRTAPYQVGLLLSNQALEMRICGGSLITTKYVLTAAHCLVDMLIVKMTFGAKQLFKKDPNEINLFSTKLKIHPDFKRNKFVNDIGVIELRNEITLSNRIQLVKLPRKSDASKSYVGVQGILTGYGVKPITFSYPKLKQLHVKIITANKCKGLDLRSNSLCGLGDPNKGSACLGDSGSPLVLKNTNNTVTQIGIVSYGNIKGCNIGLSNIYTKVSAHLDWIEQNSNYQFKK